jgi:hypothetical protein
LVHESFLLVVNGVQPNFKALDRSGEPPDGRKDVVVIECTVRSARCDGVTLNSVFRDVFAMRESRIKHLTSSLMEIE